MMILAFGSPCDKPFDRLRGASGRCLGGLRNRGILFFIASGFCARRAQKPEATQSKVPCCRRLEPVERV